MLDPVCGLSASFSNPASGAPRLPAAGTRLRLYPKSRRKPSRKLFRNEFSNKNSVKLTDFFVDFNSVRMI